MKIICNGRPREIGEQATLLELLQELDLQPDTVVSEVNRQIIAPDQCGTLHLQEGDRVELIRFVGGG